MFSKLKELNEFRQQAKKIQDELSSMIIDREKNGMRIKLNASMEILEVHLGDAPDAETLRALLNDSLKEAQKTAAQHMRSSAGLQLPGM